MNLSTIREFQFRTTILTPNKYSKSGDDSCLSPLQDGKNVSLEKWIPRFTYSLVDDPTVKMEHEATTDNTTIVNLAGYVKKDGGNLFAGADK